MRLFPTYGSMGKNERRRIKAGRLSTSTWSVLPRPRRSSTPWRHRKEDRRRTNALLGSDAKPSRQSNDVNAMQAHPRPHPHIHPPAKTQQRADLSNSPIYSLNVPEETQAALAVIGSAGLVGAGCSPNCDASGFLRAAISSDCHMAARAASSRGR